MAREIEERAEVIVRKNVLHLLKQALASASRRIFSRVAACERATLRSLTDENQFCIACKKGVTVVIIAINITIILIAIAIIIVFAIAAKIELVDTLRMRPSADA